jgi:hypothetical protein
MTLWGAGWSEQAQEDIDGLLDKALEIAQGFLGKYPTFYPYALGIGIDGELRFIAAADGDDEHPDPSELIAICTEGLIGDRDALRATAILADVHLNDIDSDAVRVSMEHREGVAMIVQLPYWRRRFPRKVNYGELRAIEDTPVIWANDRGDV